FAQQKPMPTIGIFVPRGDVRLDVFMRELVALGWRDGDTVHIERRFFSSDPPEPDRIDALAVELVGLQPHVIWTLSGPGTRALVRATGSIAIVFMNVGDPVASGFTKGIARPGGNATGFSVFSEPGIGGKWLELLREIAPAVNHVGLLSEPGAPDAGARDN